MLKKILQPSWLVIILAIVSLLFFGGNKFDTANSVYLPITCLGISVIITLYSIIKKGERTYPTSLLIRAISMFFALWVTLSFFTSQTQNVGYAEVIMTWFGVLIFITPPKWWNERLMVISGIIVLTLSSTIGLFLYLNSAHERLFGLFFNPDIHTDAWPNAFALFVLLLWPLYTLWKPKNTTIKIFKAMSISISLAALFCSFSRAGISVFAIQLVSMGILFCLIECNTKNILRKICYSVVILIISLVLAYSTLLIRHNYFHQNTPLLADKISFAKGEEVTSIQERIHFWKGSLSLITQKPFFGFGPMSFSYIYRTIQSDWLEISDHPHNIFLKLAVESGVPASFLMALIIILLFVHTLKIWPQLDNETKKQFIILWIALGGGLLHNQVDYNLNFITNNIIWWLLLTSIFIKTQSIKKSVYPLEGKISWNTIIIVISLVGALGFASLSLYPSLISRFTGQGFPLENKIFFPRYALLEEGDRARDEGKLERAIFYYQLHIEKNPIDATGYSRMGEIYRNNKDYHQALIYFEKALSKDRKNYWVHYRNYIEILEVLDQNTTAQNFTPELIKEIQQYLPKIKANLHYTAQKKEPDDLLKVLDIMARIDKDHGKYYKEYEEIVKENMEKYRINK